MATVITINDSPVSALLDTLQQRTDNMSPVLKAVGEDIMERTKQRFSTSTGPGGERWPANSQVTLMRYINSRGGFSDKTGKITKKGQALATGKKPLIGETGQLASQLKVESADNSVTVGSTRLYAAMQQYGGKKSQFPNLWGDIPARPFLPIMSDGAIYPQEAQQIMDMLQDYLTLNR